MKKVQWCTSCASEFAILPIYSVNILFPRQKTESVTEILPDKKGAFMLRNQMLTHNAYILALHYVTSQNEKMTPEIFLKKVRLAESLFLHLLKNEKK